MHEKHKARETYLESRQRYMVEFFAKELTMLTLSCFRKKNFIIDI